MHNDNIALLKRLGDLSGLMHEAGISIGHSPVSPSELGELLGLMESRVLSGKMAKDVLRESFETGKSPAAIVSEKGLEQIADRGELEAIVREVIDENPEAANDFRDGKKQAMKYMMGQVMKKTRGKANPKLASEMLRNNLKQ